MARPRDVVYRYTLLTDKGRKVTVWAGDDEDARHRASVLLNKRVQRAQEAKEAWNFVTITKGEKR